MVINLTKTTIKSTVRPLGGNLFEGKIKKYFYKEIIKEKFWSLRTDGRVEKNARKTSVLGGSTVFWRNAKFDENHSRILQNQIIIELDDLRASL